MMSKEEELKHWKKRREEQWEYLAERGRLCAMEDTPRNREVLESALWVLEMIKERIALLSGTAINNK